MLLVGYRFIEYTETPEFCGLTCHKVMSPEYTAYKKGFHARVTCGRCHIGPGASWAVKAKIDGIPLIFATILDTYERPIPSPVEKLRPARETCEQCHWPQKFSGDLIRTFPRFLDDEKNTDKSNTWVLRVGGGEGEAARDIHWHTTAAVWYVALDEKRQDIAWVGVEEDDGRMREYADARAPGKISPEAMSQKRLMDCIDCHNRATHNFRSPDNLIDQALHQGRIDAELPFIKKKGLEALTAPTVEEAQGRVEGLRTFYQNTYPTVYAQKSAALERAIGQLKEFARLTIFPDMKTTSTTHKNNLGHTDSPGCFRCHGKLTAASGPQQGTPIIAGCTTCHYPWTATKPQ
ncbi:MAG: hypothetical protein HW414_1353 [Dehalococcoidia bacterium]|nr:hypothetical protein [Dehalococcoidia bacterium]